MAARTRKEQGLIILALLLSVGSRNKQQIRILLQLIKSSDLLYFSVMKLWILERITHIYAVLFPRKYIYQKTYTLDKKQPDG